MRVILLVTCMICLSGKADVQYNKTQRQIHRVETKIEVVKAKIYSLTIIVNEKGFIE